MNKLKNKKEVLVYSFLFFLLVVTDQSAKYMFSAKPGVFKNDRFAFSLDVPTPIMYVVYVALLTILIIWFFKRTNKTNWEKLSFILILSGALSNVIERVINGYVIDFIYVFNGVLNIADFYIIAGILVLLFRKEDPNEQH